MQKIGRYQIEAELGKGAMGLVYKATDPNIGRTVALKTMRVDVHGIESSDLLRRFQNEARTAGVLNHPNIVTIYDAGEADGLFYIAMEYIEGETLAEILASNRVLSLEQILDLTRQICEGLDYAHAHGIIHRDIKPANIMVSENTAKIMDFGIAKLGGAATSTGQVLGTPNYMSPEQVRGRQLDGRSDLFSLGVMLYEMVTGERPFSAQNVTTVIYKIVNEEPIPARELDVSVHPGISAVIARTLAKDPELRPQSGLELVRELENYKSFGSDQSATQMMSATMIASAASLNTAATALQTSKLPPLATQRTRVVSEPTQARRPVASVTTRIQKKRTAQFQIYIWIAAGVIAVMGMVILMARRRPPVPAPPPIAETTQQPTAPQLPKPSAALVVGQAPASSGTVLANPSAMLGELRITTKPAGATVDIDGRRLASATPLTETGLKPGKYKVDVAHEGFAAAKRTVEITAGGSTALSVELATSRGTVKLSSNPAGADIFIDGHASNLRTPAEFQLEKGDHTVTVRKQGFEDSGDAVAVTAGQTLSLTQELNPKRQASPFRKMGRVFGADDRTAVTVATTPSGAAVFVDGKRAGQATPARIPMGEGVHYLAIRMTGYRAVQRRVKVERGKALAITETLTRKPAEN